MSGGISRRDFLKFGAISLLTLLTGGRVERSGGYFPISDDEKPVEKGWFATHRVEAANIGVPASALFVNAASEMDPEIYEGIEKEAKFEIARLLGIRPTDVPNEHNINIRCLQVVGTKGKVNLPFVVATPKDGRPGSLIWSVWGLSEEVNPDGSTTVGRTIHVPNQQDLTDLRKLYFIRLERIGPPMNIIGPIEGTQIQSMFYFINGLGWYTSLPFPDFTYSDFSGKEKPLQDIPISSKTVRNEPLLFANIY